MEASFEAYQGSTLILVAQACSMPAGSEDDGEQEKVAGKRMAKKHGLKIVGISVEMLGACYEL